MTSFKQSDCLISEKLNIAITPAKDIIQHYFKFISAYQVLVFKMNPPLPMNFFKWEQT